jgi:hypothetical protein
MEFSRTSRIHSKSKQTNINNFKYLLFQKRKTSFIYFFNVQYRKRFIANKTPFNINLTLPLYRTLDRLSTHNHTLTHFTFLYHQFILIISYTLI